MRLLNIILNLKQIRTRPYWTTREQQKSLAMLIAVAAEQQVPLQPLLTAWADDEQGVQQNRVRRLGRLLDEGARWQMRWLGYQGFLETKKYWQFDAS